jgi:hypothetical protein
LTRGLGYIWIAGRFDALSERVDGLTERLDDHTKRLDTLTRCLLDFRTESVRRFEAVDERLGFLTSAIHNMDARFPPMSKAITDFGELASRLTGEQWRTKDVAGDLAERVARLEEQVSKLMKPAA